MIHMPAPSQHSRGSMELIRQHHDTQGSVPMPWKQVAGVRIHGQQRPRQQQGSQQLDFPQHLQEERGPQA